MSDQQTDPGPAPDVRIPFFSLEQMVVLADKRFGGEVETASLD